MNIRSNTTAVARLALPQLVFKAQTPLQRLPLSAKDHTRPIIVAKRDDYLSTPRREFRNVKRHRDHGDKSSEERRGHVRPTLKLKRTLSSSFFSGVSLRLPESFSLPAAIVTRT